MDPAALLAVITSFCELGTASGDAAGFLHSKLPENELFWREFEKRLKTDPDMPWTQIRSRCYLQPAFIALSCGLIFGVDESRSRMEAHFTSFVEQPDGGRYSPEELVVRIMAVAEEAAAGAAPSDRLAGVAARRMIEERLRVGTEEILSALGTIPSTQLQMAKDLKALLEQSENQTRRLDHLTDQLEKERPSIPAGIDPAMLEALLNAQTEQILQQTEELFASAFQRRDDSLDVPVTRAEREVPVAPIESPAPIGSSGTPEDREFARQLALLQEDDPVVAARLSRLFHGGASSLAAGVRDGDLNDGTPQLLTACGRILATTKFVGEAETAFLLAESLSSDSDEKARQFVRAAGTAQMQGAGERAQKYLDRARDLAPRHPALLIAEARLSADTANALEQLAVVEPETELDQLSLHQTRARALLDQGEEESARAEFELARALDPENDMLIELGATLEITRAHRQTEEGSAVDLAPVSQAAQTFEELAARVGAQGREEESVLLSARAAEAFLLAHEHREASRVLASIRAPEPMAEDARLYMAGIAGMAARPDLVIDFLANGDISAEARVLRADAKAQSAPAEGRAEAIETLKEMLSDDDPQIARSAAFALLSAAIEFEDVAWDEAAATIVAAEKPDIELAMRAERSSLVGNQLEAQQILLPLAGRTSALRRLRDFAGLAGEWAKVKDRSRELIRRDGDPRDRLAFAEALRRLDERPGAAAEFTALARDNSLDVAIRETAFGARTEIVGENRDYEALRAASEEWHQALPASVNAPWNVLFALARLSRHEDAWALAEAEKLEPDTPARAALYGEIVSRALRAPDALVRLIAVSDRFERAIETLEALIIMTSLAADGLTLNSQTEARVRESFSDFQERFPDSRTIRTIPAPETPEEIEKFFTDLAGDAPRLQQEIGQAVIDGRAPVNALAALSSGGIGRAWSRLYGLPLGFTVEDRDRADREAAREGLGAAAVWDASSLFVASRLETATMTAIRATLPGSMLVTETLEDIDGDAMTPGRPSGETLHTPEGGFGFREVLAQEVDEERERAADMLGIAKQFEIAPAVGPDSDSELTEQYRSNAGRPEFQTLFATLLLARRTARPVFSDDRFIREAARSLHIKAFGTLALLDVMEQHGVIDAEARRSARRALAAAGAWGVNFARDELLSAVGERDFALTRAAAGALQDRARWRANPAVAWLEILPFLLAVHDAAPDSLRDWLLRALDAAENALPELGKAASVELMMVVAWSRTLSGELTKDFFQTLLSHAQRLPGWLTVPGYDPLFGPLQKVLLLANSSNEHERLAIFRLVVSQLRARDAYSATLMYTGAA
jgi:predicted nucleic acid-binding protein